MPELGGFLVAESPAPEEARPPLTVHKAFLPLYKKISIIAVSYTHLVLSL